VAAAVAAKHLVPSDLFVRGFNETIGLLIDRLRKIEQFPETWNPTSAREMVSEAIAQFGKFIKENSPDPADFQAEQTMAQVKTAVMAAPAPDIFNPTK